ncbi:hypothetical protein [Ornatilinea apprima]|uniref:hypothetical protein n=1 Tax=Ornatilinea apprima TaxID=1134406 RepID=UPI00128F52A4|nr:hypothetical protein [Ornatilinea apprima]
MANRRAHPPKPHQHKPILDHAWFPVGCRWLRTESAMVQTDCWLTNGAQPTHHLIASPGKQGGSRAGQPVQWQTGAPTRPNPTNTSRFSTMPGFL